MQGFAQTAAAGGLRAPPCGPMAELQLLVQKRPGPQVQPRPDDLLPHHPQFGCDQVNGLACCSVVPALGAAVNKRPDWADELISFYSFH